MKQPCSLLPTLSVDVVHLPEPIFLHILGLNKHDRRWARQVCKAARDALSATTAVPAAASLPLWAFQWMWKHQTSVQQSSRVVSGRAAGADLAALTWLKRSSTRSSSAVIDAAQLFGPALCAAAAGAGHIHVLQWLRTQRSQCPWDFTACTAAARTPRNLHTLVWLRQQQPRCPWAGSEVWEAAAASGCFETLHWLQSQRCPGFDSPSICAAAAGAGQVAVLQWLQQQRPPCTYDESAVAAAAAGGHVSVLQWLKEREGPHSLLLLLRHTSAECTAAAAGGHLQALHFLREVLDPPCPFSTETAVAAASGGHLAVLQYLDQQQQEERYSGTCWIPAVCAAAAAGGHLHVLQWLRNELDASCPWDPSTCRAAAAAGNLTLLQWLQAQPQPCQLHANVLYAAAESCHLEVLRWLIEEAGCPYDVDMLWQRAFLETTAAGPAVNGRAASDWRELCSYVERLRKQQKLSST